MAEKSKPEAEKSERPSVSEQRLRQAEFTYERWRLIVENGTTIEDLKRPGFYAHIARQMRTGSIIEVMPDNGSYFAELLVRDVGPQYVKVGLLREVTLETVEVGSKAFPGYTAEYTGEHLKWRVIRESDRKELKSGLATQGDAFSWISNHLKALAA